MLKFKSSISLNNEKLALFKSFSILSIHRCFGRLTGRFPVGFQLSTMGGHLSLFILKICPYHFILLFRTVQLQVRSGSHPKGPSGHGCCSDVLPPFSVPNQLLESNSVSPCGNAIQWQTIALFKSFSILSIHRCFGRPTGRFPVGFQLWTMDGHLSLFILEICP